jgi:hypothetical protein
MQRSVTDATDARTLSNGVRVTGESVQLRKWDLDAVKRELGDPESVRMESSESLLTYRLNERCAGEIRLDSSGFVSTTSLIRIDTVVTVKSIRESEDARVADLRPMAKGDPPSLKSVTTPHRSVHPVTPAKKERVKKGHAKALIITSLVLGGIAAGSYYGYQAGLFSGGRGSGVCNVPSDRASDGSRCGGRAASVRPGGRP